MTANTSSAERRPVLPAGGDIYPAEVELSLNGGRPFPAQVEVVWGRTRPSPDGPVGRFPFEAGARFVLGKRPRRRRAEED